MPAQHYQLEDLNNVVKLDDLQIPFINKQVLQACASAIENELQRYFCFQAHGSYQFTAKNVELLYSCTLKLQDHHHKRELRSNQHIWTLRRWLERPSLLFDFVTQGNHLNEPYYYCSLIKFISNYDSRPNMAEITILLNYYIFSVLSAAINFGEGLGNNEQKRYITLKMKAYFLLILNLNESKATSYLSGVIKMRIEWIYCILASIDISLSLGGILKYGRLLNNPYGVPPELKEGALSIIIKSSGVICVGCFLIGASLSHVYFQGVSRTSEFIQQHRHIQGLAPLITNQPSLTAVSEQTTVPVVLIDPICWLCSVNPINLANTICEYRPKTPHDTPHSVCDTCWPKISVWKYDPTLHETAQWKPPTCPYCCIPLME